MGREPTKWVGHCRETSPSPTNRGHSEGTVQFGLLYSTRAEHTDAAEGGGGSRDTLLWKKRGKVVKRAHSHRRFSGDWRNLTKRQFHCSTEIESAVCSLSRKEDQHRNDDGDARKFPFVTVADLVIRIL